MKQHQTQVVVATILSILGGLVGASRDDSYYKAGTGNPNAESSTMFWADASNVLDDLSYFSALYVEFHHCAWTQMRYDNDEDDEDVEENDYWYMGSMPPFGANVAFSLYGSLSGTTFNGCNGDTFINSFYTNTGFEAFSQAMYYSSQSGFSSIYNSYSSECGGGYGIGCDYENGFASHTYSTDDCNPAEYTGVSDTLSTLNSAMDGAQCVQIYNSNSNSYSYGQDDDSYLSGTGLQLLKYSSACFYQNYWSPDGECPDPYGKIQAYQESFNNGIQKSKSEEPFLVYLKDTNEAKTMNWVGGLCFMSAVVILVAGQIVQCANGNVSASAKSSANGNGNGNPTNQAGGRQVMTAQAQAQAQAANDVLGSASVSPSVEKSVVLEQAA